MQLSRSFSSVGILTSFDWFLFAGPACIRPRKQIIPTCRYNLFAGFRGLLNPKPYYTHGHACPCPCSCWACPFLLRFRPAAQAAFGVSACMLCRAVRPPTCTAYVAAEQANVSPATTHTPCTLKPRVQQSDHRL
jgi:hypothetical protein